MTYSVAFQCDSCGLCCRHVPDGCGLPHDSGTCRNLVENKCSIYASRPDICRVDVMQKVLAPNSTLEEWYATNTMQCELLKAKAKEEQNGK